MVEWPSIHVSVMKLMSWSLANDRLVKRWHAWKVCLHYVTRVPGWHHSNSHEVLITGQPVYMYEVCTLRWCNDRRYLCRSDGCWNWFVDVPVYQPASLWSVTDHTVQYSRAGLDVYRVWWSRATAGGRGCCVEWQNIFTDLQRNGGHGFLEEFLNFQD